ncbi:MAG: hypothetical protein ABI579_03770 [Candidatus Sumerlaeota bacterium]
MFHEEEAISPPAAAERRAVIIGCISAAAFFMLFAIHWAMGDQFQAYRYTAADAMYYYVVGMNVVDHGVIGFDQELPSNGFHPLWQILITGFYCVAHLAADPAWMLIVISIAAGLLLATGAVYLIVTAVARELPRTAFLLPLLPLGVYTILAFRFVGVRSLLWSQINGLESALSLIFFALFLREFLRGGLARWGACAAWLGLMILSRLDTVFILPPLVLLLGRDRGLWKPLLRIYVVVSATILVYMVTNYLYCGSPFPVSAGAKSTFPHTQGQIAECVALLLNGGNGLHTHRAAAMIIPFTVACLLIPFFAIRIFRGGDSTRWAAINLVLLAFVILRHGYDLLFVYYIHVGEWYYPISQIIITLSSLAVLERAAAKVNFAPLRGQVLTGALMGAVLVEGFFFFRFFERFWRLREPEIKVLSHAKEVRDFYGDTPARFIALDDGLIAFAFGYPSLAAIGLNLDKESVRALRNGNLLEHALSRGFDRVACFRSLPIDSMTAPLTPIEERNVRRWMEHYGLNVATHRIEIEYLPEDKSVVIFRILSGTAEKLTEQHKRGVEK